MSLNEEVTADRPAKLSTSLTPVNKAYIATPTKIMRSGLSPDFHDKVYTKKKENAPPIKANKGIKKNKEGNRETTKIDMKLAPDDTPIIPGSASGFLTTACSSAPETDNMAPAKIAMIIRGNRRSLIT